MSKEKPVTMIIEKRTVIEALLTEPLRSGTFFKMNNFILPTSRYTSAATCQVCAVGGVLRKTLGKRELTSFIKWGHLGNYELIDSLGRCSSGGNIKAALKRKKYLTALSIAFETEAEDNGNSWTLDRRELLVSFVKKNFPTRFKVTL